MTSAVSEKLAVSNAGPLNSTKIAFFVTSPVLEQHAAYVQEFIEKWFQHVPGQTFLTFSHINDKLLYLFYQDFIKLDKSLIEAVLHRAGIVKNGEQNFTTEQMKTIAVQGHAYAVCRNWLKSFGGSYWSSIVDSTCLIPAEKKPAKPESKQQEQLYDSDT